MNTGPCTFPCLNGGQCVYPDSCNCSLYQATGTHCQTVPNSGLEREMTCRSWGQYNYETFDGLYYYFPGKCSYTLLKDCEENIQPSLLIQVHNDPECTSFPYSCTRSVSLFLPWEGEIRLQDLNVTFKGQSVKLPHNIHDLELEQIADYVLVSQPQVFTLAWHGLNGSIYIKMSPEFVGRTCGLCGNFNADVNDDLKTSYEDLAMFGNSWVEEEPQKATCSMIPYLYPSPCSGQDSHEVCATLLKEPFKSCHEFVSPYSYMASCSNDLCLSGPNGDVVCQVFTEYARACAHADHPLNKWRTHVPVCGVECPAELQYRECIPCCPVHCRTEQMCIDSKLQCLDGCYCQDDLIYEDGLCVKASDCPCEHRGMLYPSGHTIQEECNNCTQDLHPLCSVTGDMYFQSFDGRVYTFLATCQYVLAKSRNSGGFTVTIQNAPCGPNLDGACIQSVNVVLNEDPRTEVTLSHSGEVFMASQFHVFQIQELSSLFVQVKTSQGLLLQYNWREFRLYLQLGELWRDDTVGLCGTFNGNIQDDFLAPSGMIESTPQLFGNAWRVSSACVPRPSLPQLDPCDTHQQAASYAVEKCEVLMQEVFAVCHEHVSPVGFQLQCRADVCKCGTPCLCSALAHYARTCRKHNVIIEFRSHVPECSVACPATMEYGLCVSSCQRRCLSFSMPQSCGDECEEGCVCPQGTYYSTHTHSCVKRYSDRHHLYTRTAALQYLSMFFLSDKLCPPGQIYEDCGNMVDGPSVSKGLACDRTCESYLLNLTCSTHEPCVPGCVCPTGVCLFCVSVCQQGTFQCEFRPCPSMCTAYGDRHYRTFDGLLFDYVGACKVYLLKSSADVMVSVTTENIDCFESGVICRKALLISVGRSFIVFDDETGKPVSDPPNNVLIWSAGYFTIVHLSQYELSVLWDRKTTIHIQAGPRWQGKLSGLCGNFDLKTVNEMRTPDNMDSATPQEFGNSWTAAEASLNPLREAFAKKQCGILLSEVFQVCHPVVDVTWFYMNCLADTCGCSRGGDCECFCSSVAAYAHRCCHQGVTVDWRSPSLCPYDCEYYNKVLGKGPIRLMPFRERNLTLAANQTSGMVYMRRGLTGTDGIVTMFMMTPGLSKNRPHDSSLVSLEALDRPNFFLHAERSGQLKLRKWEESRAFWDAATFILHRNTWISGFDSLESLMWPGFFLHYMLSRLQLLKYIHSDRYRRATLFKLIKTTTVGPQCQWRYESCVNPCFRTCSDPSARSCVSILNKMVLCLCLGIKPPVILPDLIPTPTDTIFSTSLLICVNGQLLLFNKSQSCPYDPSPPNCGLLGFAVLVNGDKCCPKWDCPCRCSVFPDLNVVTFDGNNVAIFKAASYVVTQLPNETVSILVQECNSSDNTLVWNFTNLCLAALNITHESNQVLINRLQRRVSICLDTLILPRFKKYGFEILDTGNMYLIRSPAGLKIQWFHSTGMMVIETETYTHKLSTMGLCGCCDGNPLNDLTLSNGSIMAESEDPAVFIDSWQVPNTTSYISHSRRREVNCSTSDCSACLNMLNNLTFTACHPFVPPATFCEVWVRDAEYVNNPCVALAAYVASCHKFNICIEWRSPDYCPFICPESLRYQACLPACTAPSCPNQEFEYDAGQCSGLAEGCVCPQGTLLHRPYSALCIPPNKCACTDSFGAPRALGEVWKASVDGCCMYRCESDGIVPVEFNCSDVPQPVCTRAGEISISVADDNSCCPQRLFVYVNYTISFYTECDPDQCVLDVPVCREDQTLIATRAEGSCCLAHICICDVCSEAIPECEDGELLIVDTNSTERCCPVYHCLCEPSRCPVITCPFGMAVISTVNPGQCCPSLICGRPHLPCLCRCHVVFFSTVPNLFFYECLNTVRDPVCVDGERGVMKPGQTLMEHTARGLCYTTRCTNVLDSATGFYRIQATSTNCTAQYPSACCGVCKNVSCIHHNENGTLVLYKPGKSWVSDCVRYDCSDTQSGPVLISYSYSCPPFNETECMKVNIHKYIHIVFFFIVNIVSCDGKCPSASIYNYNINTYARFCKCCREMGLQRRSVQLYCSGNSTWVNYSIQEPTDCSCQWS
uniref:Otogelin n=1 Tax=Astyanax mexicanus TaxID=7994 RepID=A0A8B9JBM9_ASTMX